MRDFYDSAKGFIMTFVIIMIFILLATGWFLVGVAAAALIYKIPLNMAAKLIIDDEGEDAS
jgi:hypothetical protein